LGRGGLSILVCFLVWAVLNWMIAQGYSTDTIIKVLVDLNGYVGVLEGHGYV
jgi:hypothetical protein